MKTLNKEDLIRINGGEMDGDFLWANQAVSTSYSSNDIGGREGNSAVGCSLGCNLAGGIVGVLAARFGPYAAVVIGIGVTDICERFTGSGAQ